MSAAYGKDLLGTLKPSLQAKLGPGRTNDCSLASDVPTDLRDLCVLIAGWRHSARCQRSRQVIRVGLPSRLARKRRRPDRLVPPHSLKVCRSDRRVGGSQVMKFRAHGALSNIGNLLSRACKDRVDGPDGQDGAVCPGRDGSRRMPREAAICWRWLDSCRQHQLAAHTINAKTVSTVGHRP
jgi:hypothetical protein